MERTYFRNNKVMASPAHNGGNPKVGDYMMVRHNYGVEHWFTIDLLGGWRRIHLSAVPNEIKVLLLLGVA